MVKRPRHDRHRNPCRVGRCIDVVRELRVPIAEAVRGIGEPTEIAVGAPAQRLLGSRRLIFERLQFGDVIQQVGELTISDAGNFGPVI